MYKKVTYLHFLDFLIPFMSKTCKNCDFSFDETFNYCPNCGQNYHEKLTVNDIFINTINNYFSVDARFFKSFFPLLFKPGFLALQFVEGKRLKYLNPAQFYLFASVVFFFLFSFHVNKEEARIDAEVNQNFKNLKAHIEKDSLNLNEEDIKNLEMQFINGEKTNINRSTLDSLVQVGASGDQVLEAFGVDSNESAISKKFYKQMFKLYKHRSSTPLIDTFYNYVPISLFVLLPIFAFFLHMMHYRKRQYAEHLVFSLYYFAFLFMLFSFFTVAHFLFEMPSFSKQLILILSFVYFYFAIRKFYKSRKRTSLAKAAIISVVFIALIIPVALAIIGTAAFLFY
ncbi:conserved hypothetical membrane protein (DUF3667) [Formosa agariphila KMM 3901]|uniref:Conserved hypothetical membrane protein (DUF3667) n=1 Tax=Formosa agariphila (strain DSM 15362 / KCTC 12365 / LMG 23005 / KMM 3901 / M-2Alg 35-1) TaxID=1347342 RepID=T2KMB3_FORAG|nr:DUF3667 domain-containing protein [Formosa agariphila]CDF79139.1 conserved hypothetical membrane protein (DUF3667) [Formosa agariphila KMM 3901]